MASPLKKLHVGILGAGEVAQVIHLPTLSLLSNLYTIAAVCDISATSIAFCASRYDIPVATTDAEILISNPEIDVIFNLTSDEFHETYTIAALRAGKNVMVEKPLTLSLASGQRILDAERNAPNGARVFVGYMRRYAPSFVNAFRRECATMEKIVYARSRGIVGPNSYFVGQSGTFPIKATDFPPGSSEERAKLLDGLLEEAFEGKQITTERRDFGRFLGSLGSHDLSLLREALGSPVAVTAVSTNEPFYSAMLEYDHGGRKFSCTYESGIDNVPRFDSGLTVYAMNKTVSILYDTPFVKGLPIKVRVEEKNEYGDMVERVVCSSYEDAYTAEFIEMHKCFTEQWEIKTSAEDAMEDLKLFRMMFERYERQLESK